MSPGAHGLVLFQALQVLLDILIIGLLAWLVVRMRALGPKRLEALSKALERSEALSKELEKNLAKKEMLTERLLEAVQRQGRTPDGDLSQKASTLAAQGLSPGEISKTLGVPEGEVELALLIGNARRKTGTQ